MIKVKTDDFNNEFVIKPTMFPDGTSQVWKIYEIMSSSVKVTWSFENESEFLHLAQLKTLLDSYHCKVDLLLTYLPYGRQDKIVSNDSTFGLRTFATLLNSLQFNSVTIIDPHSFIALELIKNSKAFYPSKELSKAIVATNTDMLCYPDKGAVSKYTSIEEMPYVYLQFISGDKVRDQLTGKILSYKLYGNPQDKRVLIVDDICDYGGTFILLTNELKKQGVKEVNLFVSHGLFSGGINVLKEAGINRIFTKDGEYLQENR